MFVLGCYGKTMIFPIQNLLDRNACKAWLQEHLHPEGFVCPHCQASLQEARAFRETCASHLTTYRCYQCDGTYNLYTGTLFEQIQSSPEEVVLLLRGVLQGETTQALADELDLSYKTALKWRHRIQAQVERFTHAQPELRDDEIESDEMFQTAGEKRRSS